MGAELFGRACLGILSTENLAFSVTQIQGFSICFASTGNQTEPNPPPQEAPHSFKFEV